MSDEAQTPCIVAHLESLAVPKSSQRQVMTALAWCVSTELSDARSVFARASSYALFSIMRLINKFINAIYRLTT